MLLFSKPRMARQGGQATDIKDVLKMPKADVDAGKDDKIFESGKEETRKGQRVRNSLGSRSRSIAAVTFIYLGNPFPRFLLS